MCVCVERMERVGDMEGIKNTFGEAVQWTGT